MIKVGPSREYEWVLCDAEIREWDHWDSHSLTPEINEFSRQWLCVNYFCDRFCENRRSCWNKKAWNIPPIFKLDQKIFYVAISIYFDGKNFNLLKFIRWGKSCMKRTSIWFAPELGNANPINFFLHRRISRY